MDSINIATSATLAFGTILCYAIVIAWIGSISGLFKQLASLQKLAVCVALAPMALSWVYAALLRLAPGNASGFYLSSITAVAALSALCALIACIRRNSALAGPRWRQRHWLEYLPPAFFAAVLIIFVTIMLPANIRLPIITNDPMEYFTVARAIFQHQRLEGVYPVLNDSISKGFYGPWTHPPGYPLIVAWLYLCQGTAAVAGIAKLFNVYAATSLALVVWAFSGGPYRWSSIVAALMVLLVPLFIRETFDMHIDIARLAVWTSIICMVPAWLTNRTTSTSLAFGILVGLSMFIHSLGVLFFGFFAGLVLLLQSGRLISRLGYGTIVATVAVLMLLPDYLVNYANFGYFIGDSVPLWQVKAQDLIPFLNEQRGIGTVYEKIINGVLGAVTNPSVFGWTTIAFSIILPAYLIVLALPPTSVRVFLTRLFRPTLINTLILSMGAFLVMLALSTALGSNGLIKNVRYVATMSALAAVASILMADRVIVLLSARTHWRLSSHGYIYAPIAVALSWALLNEVRAQNISRLEAIPINELQTDNPDTVLECSIDPSLLLVSKINGALAAAPDRQIKVLAFFPAVSAYYGRYPIVSYLDPRLLPAFVTHDDAEAFAALKALGITHVLLPSYKMGEIEKTSFASLLKDRTYFEIDRSIDGNQLLVAAGSPRLFPPDPGPLHVSPSNPILFPTSDSIAFLAYNGTDLKCIRSVSAGDFDGEIYLEAKEQIVIVTRQQIEIDVTKRYRLSFEMRVPPGSSPANTFVGLATYDAKGKLQTEEPGTYRYGVLDNANIEPSSEWKHYSGTFAGAGNQAANQFRVGTRTVAPVFLLNYNNSKPSITQFRNVIFEQID